MACSFGGSGALVGLLFHPLTIARQSQSLVGLPLSLDAETSKEIIKHLAELSATFDTRIDFEDGVGIVRV